MRLYTRPYPAYKTALILTQNLPDLARQVAKKGVMTRVYVSVSWCMARVHAM
jgi:hypothetical protein